MGEHVHKARGLIYYILPGTPIQKPGEGLTPYNEFKDVDPGFIHLINQLSFHNSFLDFKHVKIFHKNLL